MPLINACANLALEGVRIPREDGPAVERVVLGRHGGLPEERRALLGHRRHGRLARHEHRGFLVRQRHGGACPGVA